MGAIFLLLAIQSTEPRVLSVKNELVGKFGFSRSEVDSLFADPRLKAYPPGAFLRNRLDWVEYTKLILNDSSVRAGQEFLMKHREVFREAEERFGIKGEYLVSLLRLETHLGENLGEFRVMNVFYTRLRGKDGRRAGWAAENLTALALYCLVYELDCFEIRGSYAGAFGLPQFLPKTLVDYGLDADGDGMENLFSIKDAVMSAANYLVSCGWHENPEFALAKYYGSARGYPDAIQRYALAVLGSE